MAQTYRPIVQHNTIFYDCTIVVGIVVAVGDVRAMKDAVLRLDDSSIREKMSLWNLKKVKEQYGTKQVMRMLIQAYENVSKKGNK